jgi:hypothetical protein
VEPSHIAVTGAASDWTAAPVAVSPGVPTAAALGAAFAGAVGWDEEGGELTEGCVVAAWEAPAAWEGDEPEPPQALAANHTSNRQAPNTTKRRRQ